MWKITKSGSMKSWGEISPRLLDPLVSEDLKSFDMQSFYEIQREFPDVMTMGRKRNF
jgi:hypothetical protein